LISALRKIPLSVRVPLSAAVLMVLVGVIASQQVLATLSRVQDARIRELAQLHVQALSVALGPHVLRDDIWEVYDTLVRSAGGAEGGRTDFTAVTNENGRVLAATDPERAPLDSQIGDQVIGAQSPEKLTITGDAVHILLLAPLVYQGREVGQIVTELDVSDLVFERTRAAMLLLLGNAVATGVLALIGYLAMRRMLSPIARLSRRMRETAQAPEPIPESELPGGDTELTRLVRTYNTMVRAIEEKSETEHRLAERERFVSLGRLSSSLAHEINNPLGGLLNATDTIREYADRPEVVRQSSDLLKRGLEHLRDVARATLDHNRLDRSSVPMSQDDLDDVQLLIGPEIKRQQQQLEWDVAPGLTELSRFSSAPVRQVALNLLLNGSAAAKQGGRIRFGVSQTGKELRLVFEDNGPGLTDESKNRLLSSGPVVPGGGVGLRLVRDLVAELDGHIGVKRHDGITEITVRLPLPQTEEDGVC